MSDATTPRTTGVQGGGGATDHAVLASNLAWTTSGHTGTASKVASFSGAGAAAELTIGTDLAAFADVRIADTVLTLTDGATIDWNLATQRRAKVTLGGDRTLNAPTNPTAGGVYVLEVIQDGTGGRELIFPSTFKRTRGPHMQISAKSVYAWQYDGTDYIPIGATEWRVKVISGTSHTVAANDYMTVLECTSGSATTITLPAIATAGRDFIFAAKQRGAGTVTLDGDGVETIDGAATHAYPAQYSSRDLIVGSAEWSIL